MISSKILLKKYFLKLFFELGKIEEDKIIEIVKLIRLIII